MVALLLAATVASAADSGPGFRPNILYLMADDMRPQLKAYGQNFMKTPNLDALAETGLLFNRAYTQFAYCAPSRNSFMSGRRPDRTRVLNFETTFRKTVGANWTAMPEHFRKNGYFTSSAGKIYHDGEDDPQSWSYPSNQTAWIQCGDGDIKDEFNNYCQVTENSAKRYTDEELAISEGLKRLELATQSGKPWWVSVGVHRPHHKYRVPKGFTGPELYPDGALPPKHPNAPKNVPFMAGSWLNGDINDPEKGCQTCVVPSNRSVEYRRWYYAAVTYSDYMLGMVLDKVDALGLRNKTIVVFHSDHGYQLGELNEWSKKTDTELATRVPLIIRVPWKESASNRTTNSLVELVDMYKTLVDLTGVGEAEASVQGRSLGPEFDTPGALAGDDVPAFSQIGRCGCKVYPEHDNQTECNSNACAGVPLNQFEYMGYSMRTEQYRYTAWFRWDQDKLLPKLDALGAEELYDLTADTGDNFDYDGYSFNIAGHPDQQQRKSAMLVKLKAAISSWR